MEEIAIGGKDGVRQRLLKPHAEKHFTAGEMVRDVIMGMSDGLTVPFALAAGLSGADASSSIILTAGLAEVAAGAISMGLGGYLAAKSESDHYRREQRREQEEIISVPEVEASEVADILAQYGLEPKEYWPVVNALQKRPEAWLEFMMRFELGLEKPDPKRALQSAVTIAIAYVIGGLVPLIPYMFIRVAKKAVLVSVIVTLISLLFFGYFKGHFVGNKPIRSALQTTIIGAIASAAAYGIARAVQA
jgi:VIT1/CCC1 family predicted Fe2+/Mn2+ transporter